MKIEPSVLDAVRQHHRILCTSHIGPDGDAYGSLLGMGWILRHLGKEPILAMHDPTPDAFQLMPGAEAIIGPQAVAADYDAIIALDASSVDRLGTIYRPADHGHIPLLVIDHHFTNTRFGQINWVDPSCAATCQMLVGLADALAVPLTGAVAECLLTGIVTDTLCFRTSNTDAAVLDAAVRLTQSGIKISDIVARTLNRREFNIFRLWGEVLTHAQLEEGVIWTTISRADRAAAGDPEDDGQLSSMLITAVEADISATFTEKVDETGQIAVECSFRAKPGFDVGTLAFELGGGGHPPASGVTLPGSLPEVSARVVAALKAAHRAQR
ncbi:MAG TPA: bifunctional oligoribonuclease/PAP phosphatase NrnA [Caldilineaceae bacterium]|mgnify:CR=1 FL=1|nr:bifunctional oligoribonuclease/PAP phosphatase NrnA [Caldilineaceae bacterium]